MFIVCKRISRIAFASARLGRTVYDLHNATIAVGDRDLFANQGFRWGRNVLALQFHLEVDRAMVAEWLADDGCAAEVAATAGISAQGIQRDTATHGEQLERLSAAYFTEIVRQLTPNTTA